MKNRGFLPVISACLFTWLGFVGAISFLEAWLKFQAPGVTLPIGLGIGRLVFAALNKIEWVFAIAILLCMFLTKNRFFSGAWLFFSIAIGLLIAQTVWLLPALDARAGLYITGQPVEPSNLHVFYVIAEGIKVISLLILGIRSFR